MSKPKRLARADYNAQMKDRTRGQVLAAAMRVAKRYGLTAVKRDAVATEAQCGAGTVNFHFQTIGLLQHEVLALAVRTRVLRVIAEGVVGSYPAVAAIPAELRTEALAAYNKP